MVEADESDRSMLSLHVDIAVVTNVELDHHATFGSLAEVRDVFRAWLAARRRRSCGIAPTSSRVRGEDPFVGFDVAPPRARRHRLELRRGAASGCA